MKIRANKYKKAVKASYGGWGKFYGLNDVEFIVPNDTDDPTIYYNGNYYNYYAIEDTLWDYYKDECAENGVSPDENEFEKWVADNSYYVYDLLDEIQPKSEPGRGVYRENANTLRKSIKSSRQRRPVKASYTYKYAVWVLDGDDNTWKCWGGKDSTDLGMSEDEFLDSINHQTYPNPEYNVDKNYVDVMVIDGDKTPADYGQTENVKEYGEIAESTRRAVKASNVMAASDVSNLKIYVPSMCYVDVMVDNYEQGEGEQVNSWDFSVSSEPYNSAQELIDDIARHSGIFSNNIADYVVLDGSLQTDAEVTVDNEIPTDADYEAWKRGELELFVAHLWVNLQVGAETHDITDDEAEGFGLSVY